MSEETPKSPEKPNARLTKALGFTLENNKNDKPSAIEQSCTIHATVSLSVSVGRAIPMSGTE